MEELPKLEKPKKKFYKKWWFWGIVIFVIVGIVGNLSDNSSTGNSINNEIKQTTQKVVNFNDTLSSMSLSNKNKLCVELCAGEDINIPAVKDQCSLSCYQIYYYEGEEGLNQYLIELKGEQN